MARLDLSDPVQREDYWRQTLKTMVPYGLKIEERLCLLFLHVNISFFYAVMSVCFKDYDFGIKEFVLLVYIVTSVVAAAEIFSL